MQGSGVAVHVGERGPPGLQASWSQSELATQFATQVAAMHVLPVVPMQQSALVEQ
jgi:hypothetical protein